MKLTTPSGVQIGPDTRNPQVRYARGNTYCLYIIDGPETGQWQVELRGTDIPQPEQVNLTVSGESPLVANSLAVTAYFRRGRSVPITVQLAEVRADSLQTISSANVVARIHKPAIPAKQLIQIRRGKFNINLESALETIIDEPAEIRLYDNGRSRNGDEKAGDGIFSGIYRDTGREGPYEIEIECRARLSDGQSIERTLRESFHVGDLKANEITLAELLALMR